MHANTNQYVAHNHLLCMVLMVFMEGISMRGLIAIYLGVLPLSLLCGWGIYSIERDNFWRHTGIFALIWTCIIGTIILIAWINEFLLSIAF